MRKRLNRCHFPVQRREIGRSIYHTSWMRLRFIHRSKSLTVLSSYLLEGLILVGMGIQRVQKLELLWVLGSGFRVASQNKSSAHLNFLFDNLSYAVRTWIRSFPMRTIVWSWDSCYIRCWLDSIERRGRLQGTLAHSTSSSIYQNLINPADFLLQSQTIANCWRCGGSTMPYWLLSCFSLDLLCTYSRKVMQKFHQPHWKVSCWKEENTATFWLGKSLFDTTTSNPATFDPYWI